MIARFGLDPQRLRFSLRTALAACAALLVSWAIGLEHPQWSAMTVFAASQPARNMLLEKSFFRGVGTVVGTTAGVVLVWVSGGAPAVVVAGLALWVGLCALLGNVLRGLVSYGTLLAGYSAAMVALLETGHPDRVFLLGADRLLTVMTGIVMALVVGLAFTPRDADDPVVERTRHLISRVLRQMASRLRGLPEPLPDTDGLLHEMALVEEGLDPHGAGSLRSRRSARTLRMVLAAQLSALVWLRTTRPLSPMVPVADALLDAAGLLERSAPPAEVIAAMERAGALASRDPALQDVIGRFEAPFRDRLGVNDDRARRRVRGPRIVLHRDWIAARQAALRSGGILLLLGAVWVMTGWHAGPYLLLGTAVMITLFSTWEDPAWIMGQVLVGQVFGAIGAVLCRWLVWPHAGAEITLVLMLMPFVLLGALPLAHRRTMYGATDYCMILLLLSQPSLPLTGSFGQTLSLALAVVAGPAIALAGFRMIYPADAHRRMRMLMHAMVHELESMAAGSGGGPRAGIWRARLEHRLLRLVRWAEKSGESRFSPAGAGLAVLAAGSAILGLQELRGGSGLSAGAARAVDVALGRLRTLSHHPERAAAALDTAARRLEAAGQSDPALTQAADLARAAATALRANRVFFTLAAGLSDSGRSAPGGGAGGPQRPGLRRWGSSSREPEQVETLETCGS